MSSDYKYGQEGKRIVFQDSDKRHADLRIRLRHDGMTQVQFFRAMITGYINREERIVDFITDFKFEISKQGKAKIHKTRTILSEGQELSDLFNLDEKETKEIFDMIAKELPDL